MARALPVCEGVISAQEKGPVFASKPTKPAASRRFFCVLTHFITGKRSPKKSLSGPNKERVFSQKTASFIPSRPIAAGDFPGFSVAKSGSRADHRKIARPVSNAHVDLT